jgi:hypothetical protein
MQEMDKADKCGKWIKESKWEQIKDEATKETSHC